MNTSQPTEEAPRLSTPPASAAGLKAVTNAAQMTFKVMGPGKALKLFQKLNQQHGIDCPGCAWPDPEKRSRLGEFCENGAKAIAEEAMDANANAPFFEKYSVAQLMEKSDYWLGQQGRLTEPLIIREGQTHYQPISWQEAFGLIGQHLKALPSPNEAVFYTSGRSSNEAAFLYQLFVRMYGTNNLPDCSNMCHESSGVALGETLGLGKGSVTLDDFGQAELIMIFGQNPGTNHPRMLSALEKAKANGAKIVTINPLKEVGLVKFKNPQTAKGVLKGQALTDMYLQVRINEDVALLKVLLKKLLARAKEEPQVLDHEFINSRSQGFQALEEDLAHHSLKELIARTGLAEEDIDVVVGWLAGRQRIIACWAMGLTQHVNAVDNIREVVNLLLAKGSIGKPGAGTCPVRGHSNVQGDRTMGIWERPKAGFLEKLGQQFQFNPPTQPGYNVVEAIEAMHGGLAKVFIALGGNFVAAAPDTEQTYEALRRCTLTVQISTKLNRSHLVHGKTALILPCLGRTDRHIEKGGEQFVSVENSMGVVHTSYGMLSPRAKTLKSEPAIIAGIAQAALPPNTGKGSIEWAHLVEDYSRIRQLISQTIAGFEDYNARIAAKNGFALPNGPREGRFTTPSQKAQFTINQLPQTQVGPGEFLMMTIRSHDQFNTTVYGLDDRYRGVHQGRRVVFVHPADCERLGLAANDTVHLSSHYGGVQRNAQHFAVVPYDIPQGCVATYFPEANPLVPLSLHARHSHTPASKSVVVRLHKA